MRNVTKLLQMLFVAMLTAFVFATQGTAQVTLLTESFENGGAVPSGWATEVVLPTCPVYFPSATAWPSGYSAYNGTYMVGFQSFSYSSGETRLKQTTPFSTVGYTNVAIDFAWLESTGYSGATDHVDVEWSTNGTVWTTAGTFNRYNAVPGWKIKNVALPAGAQGQAALYIAFRFTSMYGYDCYLDFAHVTAVGPPPPATVTIGTGTLTTGYPYLTYWHDGRTQLLYTAAEITAAGGAPGEISTIGFNVYSYSSQTMNGFNVRLQNTAATGITGFVTSGWTTCYTGTYAVPGTGWRMITLQTPFVWDGSNLLLEICFDNTSYTSYSYVYATAAAANMVRYYYTDGAAGCSFTSTYTSTSRPNLRFVIQPWVGTLTGTVTNSYNGTPLVGATIAVPGMPNATSIAGGLYTMYNVPVGNKNVTGSMTNFVPQTKPALIQNQQTTVVDFALDPIPGVLTGIVYNAATGNPLIGAEITVNGKSFFSTAGGAYTCNVYPVGTFNTVCGKPGFDPASQSFVYVQGSTLNYNWGLWESTNPPYSVTAALNAAETQVDINWLIPRGYYEQIYDDGIAENWTVWATAGNRNGVKFTPVGYPALVYGGFVNIGTINNYPAGSNPLVPFQVAVYDASGTGGVPGVALDTFDVTPANYGWVSFSFPYPVVINSGSFYLVMIQGGNAPDAAGIAVDETTPALRSYSSFNNGNWVPAGGNFMLRAIVYGSGGPLLLDGMEPTAPLFVEGRAADNAIYQNTPTTASGYEAKGSVRAFDWASLASPSLPDASMPPPSGIQALAADLGVGGPPIPERTKPLTTRAVLFDNGPLVNSPGTGAGGADESVLIAPLNSYGANWNNAIPYTVADDFNVTGGTWTISSIESFGYQTGSTTTSTFTALYIRIWNGQPGTPGASVVWGDLTTNRMTGNTFSNIYRVQTPSAGQNTRPIMHLTANTPGLTLNPGFYWIEMATTGSLASGPWIPPITITGQNTTGNALQWTGSWVPIQSGGFNQGVPFIVNGSVTTGTMNYEVWRLKQGEEGTPGVWTTLGQTTATSATDTWTLPCGPYRWAVEAIYPVARYSPPTFSNVIGKCWTAGVTINVTPSCTANPVEGSLVKLQNNPYPDTMYVAMTPASGQVVFPNVWKGNYTLTVTRYGYTTYTQVVDIMGDMTIDVILLQVKAPPTNLFVDDRSLEAIWNQPVSTQTFFTETWTSGSFATNSWVTDPASGSNWSVYLYLGNPAPSTMFNWYPNLIGYDQYLISKTITPIGAPTVLLKYDIYLSNFMSTGDNFMYIEVWDGLSWHIVKEYANTASINWKTEYVDISQYASNNPFKIRFHASGGDSFYINNWNFDNISLVGSDGVAGYNPCILGYNFYLNTVLSAIVTDTVYTIPGNQVEYGHTYNACVNAIYGSGNSTEACYLFTSHFLYPPRNLEVEAVECSAYLTWEKPVTAGDGDNLSLRAFEGEVEHTPAILGKAPVNMSNHTDGTKPGNGSKGSIAFGVDATAASFVDFDVDNLSGMTIVAPAPTSNFWHGAAFPVNEPNYAYFTDGGPNLYEVDRATGAITNLGSMGSVSGTILDMTVDPTTGTFYLAETNGSLTADNLYTVDPSVPSRTLVGPTGTTAGLIGLACDGNGAMWGYDLVNDQFYSIDKATGTATVVGSIGFNANYGQNMFYDQATTTITMAAFNSGSFMAEIRAVDVATGASVVLSSDADQMTACALPVTGGGGGATPPGLIGYNVYRDEAFIAYVSGQDTTWYYDLNLDPDTYLYAVTAVYDLTDYGFPGEFDESLIEGPDTVDIICGRPLPFFEPWDQSSFSYNDWSFNPGQGNWVMNSGVGNPAPTADFSWQPMIYNYSYALESPILNAGPWTCAAMWLDFDYKLVDRNATGDELLTVEVFYNGTWHNKAEYANNGSVDWTSEHFDISSAQGKALKVRFVASGAASEDILHWYVDNIHVYGICNSPVDLTGSVSLNNVTLTWVPPTCEGGGGGGTPMSFIFDDGTAESGWAINPGFLAWLGNEFPIAPTYSGVIQSFDVYFYYIPPTGEVLTIDLFDGTQTLVGSSDPFTTPDAVWLNVLCNDIPFSGMFYGMVKWDNLGGGTNYMGYDTDGPFAGDDLEWYYDGSAWDKLTNLAGAPPGVFLLRANGLVGGDLKSVELVAGGKPTAHITDASALIHIDGFFDTKNYATTGVRDNETDSSQIIGYNVYRTDVGAQPPYNKLNASPVPATTYLDVIPNTLSNYGHYKYYVTSMFNDSQANAFLCESPGSDTVDVEFPAVGINEPGNNSIVFYPNPATEIVNVASTAVMNSIEVMNYVGQSVFTLNNVDSKTAKFNVTSLRSGVYFVKVTTSEGIRTSKITVTH